jgi:signal transduction histidine kinase
VRTRIPLRLPRRTIRLRLTILYAGLFLASGVGLIAITFGLASSQESIVGTKPDGSTFSIAGPEPTGGEPPAGATRPFQQQRPVDGEPGGLTAPQSRNPEQLQAQAVRDQALLERQHDAEMRRFLERSGIALVLMAAVSILLGWIVAGRVLRPLRTLNERAREISATNLHRRLALAGPDDELTQLAGTFDDLLARLDASFQAQRQFVANASHELRTPLARSRTLAEVALADPEASADSLRASHRRVLAAGEQQERLIEALLTLARSERGLDEREHFDLAAVTDSVLATRRSEAARRGLELQTALEPARTCGDPRLAERLVANLIDNAFLYNQPHGRVGITTTTRSGRAVLSVSNSGPPVPPDAVERLFQPFQRAGADRTDRSDGTGLGLSIVEAIATVHGASIAAEANPDGGLEIEVSFLSAEAAEGRAGDMSRAPTRARHVFRRRRLEAERG